MTGKAEAITREEAGKACIEMATSLRQGALTQIKVLKSRLFDEAATPDELEPIWMMAGDYLGVIIRNFDSILEDIEAGAYLPDQTGEV